LENYDIILHTKTPKQLITSTIRVYSSLSFQPYLKLINLEKVCVSSF